MIGVVGGGIAGLSAARRLQAHGHDVQVFEASDQVGGLAAVYETAGDPIEKFYHHHSTSSPRPRSSARSTMVCSDFERW